MSKVQKAKHHWKRVPVVVRKPFILVLGCTVVIAGIILLPLPGPGWIVIFLGFAILATEFEKAERIRDWCVTQGKRLLHWMQNKQKELKDANEQDNQARKHKQ